MVKRTSLSSVEVGLLARELQCLLKGKVDSIHVYKTVCYLGIHVPNTGKSLLKIALPHFMFLASDRKEKSERQSIFGDALKKQIMLGRIESIEQHGNERIIVITFALKEHKRKLVVELFSQGNIVICDEHDVILDTLTTKQWAQRHVKRGETYVYPETLDVFSLNEEIFVESFKSSDKQTILKTLALHFGLGGLFAEEIILQHNLNKEAKSLTVPKIKPVYETLMKLKKHALSPSIVLDGETIIDFTPWNFKYYKHNDNEAKKTFSEAIETFVSEFKTPLKTSYDKKIGQLKTIIEAQTKNLKKAQKQSEEQQAKGDLLYHKYQEIKKILDSLEKAREKLSWKEIKAKLKDHKVIKSIDEKSGKIILDL